MILHRLILTLALLFGLFSFSTGFAEQHVKQDQPANRQTQLLQERVEAYWQARAIDDQIAAFEFEEANVTGKKTLQQYIRKSRNAVIQQAKVLNVEIVGPVDAIARIVITVAITGLSDPITGQIEDPWVYIDGQWYHRQKRKS